RRNGSYTNGNRTLFKPSRRQCGRVWDLGDESAIITCQHPSETMSMNRTTFLTSALLLAGSLLAWQYAASQSSVSGSARLPGARPAIDAANYSSLQAAIDALPPGGGVVRLPAGTFEINQPL